MARRTNSGRRDRAGRLGDAGFVGVRGDRLGGSRLSGGHLYNRRLAAAAGAHDARLRFVPADAWRSPLLDVKADVVVVDSLVAAETVPWLWGHPWRSAGAVDRVPDHAAEERFRNRRALTAIVHQSPGGVDRSRLPRSVRRRLDMALYRRCELVVVASAALGDELVVDHDLDRRRVRVVPPGCDLSPVASTPPSLRAGRRTAFLCVANWLPNKGIVELLDAVARIPDGDATVHLVGADRVDGSYAAKVRRRLASPELAGRVVVHGQVSSDEVARLYRGADVFVLPSYREAYGTVYAEALAAGLPVVGWRVPNLTNLVDDGREGVLVDPGDIAGLSAALGRLAVDDPWRMCMSEAARRRGQLLPTWDDTAIAFFGALSELMSMTG